MKKTCLACEEEKDFNEFHNSSASKDGTCCWCKNCCSVKTKKYLRTKRGLTTRMYSHQRASSKKRGHPEPSYDSHWLREWVLSQPEYDEIYKAWVLSGYDKNYTPSIDRIDDYKPYTKENIQITWWSENNKKRCLDMMLGKNNKVNKKIIQKDVHGNAIAEHYSIGSAARKTNVSRESISLCCRGKTSSAGGYCWDYL